MRVVRLPGRKWVTCSTSWVVSAVGFILFGLFFFFFFIWFMIRDGPDGMSIFVAAISLLFCSIPWFTRAAVSVSSTHLRRAPQIGLPFRVPLSEITQMWPTDAGVGSSAGDLIELYSSTFSLGGEDFHEFGPRLAEMVGAEWLPMEPVEGQVL